MPNMMENSDAEIIERYLLYMRYAVHAMESQGLMAASYELNNALEIKMAHPHITFPRVKLALTVIP